MVGGWWRLVVDGSWRLAVGGPLGRSLRAVLSKKKKIWSLKDRPGSSHPIRPQVNVQSLGSVCSSLYQHLTHRHHGLTAIGIGYHPPPTSQAYVIRMISPLEQGTPRQLVEETFFFNS